MGRRKPERIVLAVCGALLIPSGYVRANNGDQMVGYSAITNAMGGAVVAAPQDVTTSLSNPAGLAFLDKGPNNHRFDMNLGLLLPSRTLNGVESDDDVYVMPTGGFAFDSDLLGKDYSIGVGAYPVSGGGVDFAKDAFTHPRTGEASVVASRQSLRIGPALAWQATERFSVGANLSLSSNQMSLKNPQYNFPNEVAYGASFVLGSVFRFSERWQLGAAYTSRTYSEDLVWNTNQGTYRLEFEDPQTAALGLAYRPTPGMQLTADLKWLNYSEVRDENTLQTPAGEPDQTLAYGWDDQYVVAVGAKYAATPHLTVYAGYNHGDSPIEEEDVNSNIGATAIVEDHLSGGGTVRITDFSSLSLSWIHGFENELTASEGLPTEVKFETDQVTLQFTYRH